MVLLNVGLISLIGKFKSGACSLGGVPPQVVAGLGGAGSAMNEILNRIRDFQPGSIVSAEEFGSLVAIHGLLKCTPVAVRCSQGTPKAFVPVWRECGQWVSEIPESTDGLVDREEADEEYAAGLHPLLTECAASPPWPLPA